MAVTAGVIQAGGGNHVSLRLPARDELVKASWVDRHPVGMDIAGEFGRVARGQLDYPGHVAFRTRQIDL